MKNNIIKTDVIVKSGLLYKFTYVIVTIFYEIIADYRVPGYLFTTIFYETGTKTKTKNSIHCVKSK